MYFISVSVIILKANIRLVTFLILLSQICLGYNNVNIREYYGTPIPPPSTAIPYVDILLQQSNIQSSIECLSLCVTYPKCAIIIYSISERVCILRKIKLLPEASSFINIPAKSIHYMLQAPDCPTSAGYTYRPEFRLCFQIGVTLKTWNEAADACNNDRGQLIQIDRLEVQNYLKKVLTSSNLWRKEWFHIGLCKDNKDVFVWQNGQALIFNSWMTGRPNNNLGVERCTGLDPDDDFNWNDYQCNNPQNDAIQICEIVVQ